MTFASRKVELIFRARSKRALVNLESDWRRVHSQYVKVRKPAAKAGSL
jgi:hypothetical protein